MVDWAWGFVADFRRGFAAEAAVGSVIVVVILQFPIRATAGSLRNPLACVVLICSRGVTPNRWAPALGPNDFGRASEGDEHELACVDGVHIRAADDFRVNCA